MCGLPHHEFRVPRHFSPQAAVENKRAAFGSVSPQRKNKVGVFFAAFWLTVCCLVTCLSIVTLCFLFVLHNILSQLAPPLQQDKTRAGNAHILSVLTHIRYLGTRYSFETRTASGGPPPRPRFVVRCPHPETGAYFTPWFLRTYYADVLILHPTRTIRV